MFMRIGILSVAAVAALAFSGVAQADAIVSFTLIGNIDSAFNYDQSGNFTGSIDATDFLGDVDLQNQTFILNFSYDATQMMDAYGPYYNDGFGQSIIQGNGGSFITNSLTVDGVTFSPSGGPELVWSYATSEFPSNRLYEYSESADGAEFLLYANSYGPPLPFDVTQQNTIGQDLYSQGTAVTMEIIAPNGAIDTLDVTIASETTTALLLLLGLSSLGAAKFRGTLLPWIPLLSGASVFRAVTEGGRPANPEKPAGRARNMCGIAG